MNLSTQLRIILLLVGAAIWLAIYLFGKRKSAQHDAAAPVTNDCTQAKEAPPGFTPAEDVEEDEFETPAYLRRQGQREPRQDYEPRIASAHDYVDMDEVRDDERQFMDDDIDRPQVHAAHAVQAPPLATPVQSAHEFADPAEVQQHEPVYAEPHFDKAVYIQPEAIETAVNEPVVSVEPSGRREPTIEFDKFVVVDDAVAGKQQPAPVAHDGPVRAVAPEPPTLPNIPVVDHSVETATNSHTHHAESVTGSGPNTAPTLSDAVPAPAERMTVRTSQATAQSASVSPPAASASKSSGNAARRKIIALRVPMPQRVPGSQLLSLLQGECLQHGKFSIFHRMQNAGTVFSVASMVEPGTFDPQVMGEQQFPGVTLFMLLPGPVDGLVAYDQMLSCAQRIAHATGGVLQDERGSKLTPQTMEKLRDEVLDFQHLIGGMAAAT